MGCLYILSLYLFPISFIGLMLGMFYGKETLVSIMGTICFISLVIINYVKIPYMIGMYKAKREDNEIKWKYVFGLSHVNMLYGIICPVLFVALFVLSIIYNGLTWMHIVALLLFGIWIYSVWRSVE